MQNKGINNIYLINTKKKVRLEIVRGVTGVDPKETNNEFEII